MGWLASRSSCSAPSPPPLKAMADSLRTTNSNFDGAKAGATGRIRTADLYFTKVLLCQLSYGGMLIIVTVAKAFNCLSLESRVALEELCGRSGKLRCHG